MNKFIKTSQENLRSQLNQTEQLAVTGQTIAQILSIESKKSSVNSDLNSSFDKAGGTGRSSAKLQLDKSFPSKGKDYLAQLKDLDPEIKKKYHDHVDNQAKIWYMNQIHSEKSNKLKQK